MWNWSEFGMKKFFKFVGILLLVFVVAIAGFVCFRLGVFDTRFWSKNGYETFQTGTYVCGQSISEGSYDVIIKGGAQDTGSYTLYTDAENPDDRKILEINWVRSGDKGFHFDITDGQAIQFNFRNSTEMRIKKVS